MTSRLNDSRPTRTSPSNQVHLGLCAVCQYSDVSGSGIEDAAVLFGRTRMEDDSFVNEFSVPTPGNPQMYSRAFVSHRGTDTGSGTWSCSKDPATTRCIHTSRARDKLQQLLQRNPQAKDLHSEEVDTTDAGYSGTTKYMYNVMFYQTNQVTQI